MVDFVLFAGPEILLLLIAWALITLVAVVAMIAAWLRDRRRDRRRVRAAEYPVQKAPAE